MALRIISATYRGDKGFLVTGTDRRGLRPRVYTTTRGAAEHIKAKLAAGEELVVSDYAPRAPHLTVVRGGKARRKRPGKLSGNSRRDLKAESNRRSRDASRQARNPRTGRFR